MISTASHDDDDLYFFKSVLVTSCWNLNDDVFLPDQLWKARYTPKHKQINLEHNHKQVIGHIIDCNGISEDGNTIEDSCTNLPSKIHLVTSGVLYKFLCSHAENLESDMQSLLKEVEDGKYFVSMEVLFYDFDYAFLKGDQTVIVNRNSTTASLSQHLKAYGGTGTYKNHKIGRVLKDLTFSGKGLVKKPANPESIIFTNALSNAKINNSVYSSKTLKEKKVDLDKKVEMLERELETTKSSLVLANTQKMESEKKLVELGEKEVKAKIEGLTSQLTAATESVKTLEAQVKTEQAGRKDLEEKLKVAEAALSKANEDLEKVNKEKKTVERLNKWVDKTGASKEDAEKVVASFVELTDLQFDSVLATQKVIEKEDKNKKLEEAEPEKQATMANAGVTKNEAASKLAQHFVNRKRS